MIKARRMSRGCATFINRGFDPCITEQEELAIIELSPNLSRRASKESEVKKSLLCSAEKKGEFQRTLLTLLTLSVGVEAAFPPYFYEKVFVSMEGKLGGTLNPELVSFAKNLLCEEVDGWNQLRDDEMIHLVKLWATKSP